LPAAIALPASPFFLQFVAKIALQIAVLTDPLASKVHLDPRAPGDYVRASRN
jgi:hypothetical protein